MKNLFLILTLLFNPNIRSCENEELDFFPYHQNIDFKIAITTAGNNLLSKIFLGPRWSSHHSKSIKNFLQFVPIQNEGTVGLLLYNIPETKCKWFINLDDIHNRKIRMYFANNLFFESQLAAINIDKHSNLANEHRCLFTLYTNTDLNQIPPLKVYNTINTDFSSLFNTSKNFTLSITDDFDNTPFFEYILPLNNYNGENREPSSLYFIPPYDNPNMIGILAESLLATWGKDQNPFKRTQPKGDGHSFRDEFGQYIKNIENAGKKAWLTIYLGEGNKLFTGEFLGIKVSELRGYGAQLGATTHDVLFVLAVNTIQGSF